MGRINRSFEHAAFLATCGGVEAAAVAIGEGLLAGLSLVIQVCFHFLMLELDVVTPAKVVARTKITFVILYNVYVARFRVLAGND